MSKLQFNHVRLLRYATYLAYLCAGLPLSIQRAGNQPGQIGDMALLAWIACYLVFGVVYWLLTRQLGSRVDGFTRVAVLLILTGTALAVGGLSKSGVSALLLVIVAAVVPWIISLPLAMAWMVLAHVALIPLFYAAVGWSLVASVMQAVLYFGFSALMFIASLIASQQADEREELRHLNAELRATRALLAESTRIAERMRIARDLHDLVGHHLTALSLNLEVASHLTNDTAREHVLKAQKTAKQLLADVREVVSELRQDDAIDLTQALRSLTEGVPGLAVHLSVPPRFGVEDPRRAQMLLRCAQEILTNTVRHANARNLWLTFRHTGPDELCLDARDDGRGSTQFHPGNGLNGMRERLAEFGGTVTFGGGTQGGFALTARLPLGEEPTLAHAPARHTLEVTDDAEALPRATLSVPSEDHP
ncbi:MAG: sensor histidine kinase [Luteibacter sp.]|uniref:sensor histidine kinase n=1 Tax=Luteibacter TaxID=242605 RepID=UPI0009DE7352|nr:MULTISPECIES: sensor histidine kinase [unclassified Luteibacter]MDQ7997632.1 sensor histidine kinase [Luteibacter sp.]MDQ8047844.1 sensor histidine kinase [Luteibacter sp.]